MTYKGWYVIKPNKPTNQQTKQTNDLCEIEFLEIELFDHLTVCKQMTYF